MGSGSPSTRQWFCPTSRSGGSARGSCAASRLCSADRCAAAATGYAGAAPPVAVPAVASISTDPDPARLGHPVLPRPSTGRSRVTPPDPPSLIFRCVAGCSTARPLRSHSLDLSGRVAARSQLMTFRSRVSAAPCQKMPLHPLELPYQAFQGRTTVKIQHFTGTRIQRAPVVADIIDIDPDIHYVLFTT